MSNDLTNDDNWTTLVHRYETACEQPGRTGIGTTINLRRVVCDWKKGDLAQRMSCGTAKISDLESGTKTPTLMELGGIALALGWDVESLLFVACTLKGTAVNAHSHSLSMLLKRS